MASPLDALNFREVYGRTLRRNQAGRDQAFQVAPFGNDMSVEDIGRMVRQVQGSLIRCIDYGEVFYVSRDIVNLMTDTLAHPNLAGHRLFHLDVGDVPSLTGFVYFDGPIPIPTIYSPTGYQNLVAIAWDQFAIARDDKEQIERAYHGAAEEADPNLNVEVVGKILYTICSTPNDEQRNIFGRWKARHWIPAQYGQRFHPTNLQHMARDDSQYRDMGLTEEEIEQDDKDTIEGFDTLFKIFGLWLAMIKEEIPVRHPSDRNHDRVMHKEGRPPGIVKITHLRRYAQDTTDGAGMAEVNWAYRWEVRGHYRNQRVGPGRTLVKRVWVPKHIKGPSDKPLVIRDTITSLDR